MCMPGMDCGTHGSCSLYCGECIDNGCLVSLTINASAAHCQSCLSCLPCASCTGCFLCAQCADRYALQV